MITLHIIDLCPVEASGDETTLTATKCETGDTNAPYASPDDIYSNGIKRSIHLVPGKTRTELDRFGRRINRYLVEACQGDLNTTC